MKIVIHRCTHCQAEYEYQASGHGCNAPLNDSRYCQDCKRAILSALEEVPRRCEQTWVDTTEVTIQQILEWQRVENERVERERANGRLIFQEVAMPLFSLDGGPHPVTGYVRQGRRRYYYEYTPGRENEAVIRVEMERNLETGQLTYW